MARFLRALPWLVAFIMVASLAACVSQPPAPETQPSGAPVRLAFYYGWFGGAHGAGWNQQGLDPFTKYHPTDGYYNSSDLSLVQKQVGEMQYAGLQGGIASWWGQGSLTDQNVAVDLQAARGTTFRWTLYYEPEGSGNPSVSQIQSDLNYIKTKYANNPAFLHLDGSRCCLSTTRMTRVVRSRTAGLRPIPTMTSTLC